MSRVLLISTNTCRTPYPVYPLGMAVVAASLDRAGHDVFQFDWLAAGGRTSALHAAVRASRPDLVAVSIRNMDHVDSTAAFDDTWEMKTSREVVALVRKATSAPVVIGGPAVAVMTEQVREYVDADVAVVGEGECAILDIARFVEQGRSLPRVWPAAEPMAGECQARPLFDPSLVAYYRQAGGLIGLQTKRGCPYACCYCTYPVHEGRCLRVRPVGAVMADLERLQADFGIDAVFFADSVFNDPQGQYLELAEALARRRLGLRWAAYFSPRGLSAEAVALCKQAGLFAVELGTDAATDTTLEQMNKPFGWEDVRRANDLLVEQRVACAHYVVFGGPGETPATLHQGLDHVASLDHCVVFGFSGLRLYPEAPLYRRALAEGLVHAGDSLFEPVYYVSPGVDKAWMESQVTRAWKGRADRVFPPAAGQRLVARLRTVGFKGLLWDRLIGFPQDRSETSPSVTGEHG